MNLKISEVHAREVIDCRRFPTVEVDVRSDGELSGRALVPAGRSTGRRGPNQESALSACLDLVGLEDVGIVAIDTDGTDGLTDLAGGIVDGSTLPTAQAKEIDVFRALHDHDASRVLQELGDAMVTGHTGTNVNDLRLLLVG